MDNQTLMMCSGCGDLRTGESPDWICRLKENGYTGYTCKHCGDDDPITSADMYQAFELNNITGDIASYNMNELKEDLKEMKEEVDRLQNIYDGGHYDNIINYLNNQYERRGNK